MDPGKDASNRLKLGTAFLYSAAICMHYRQIGCTNTQCSKVGALQPRAQGFPHNGISSSHNGISGSHNGTGSAPRGWRSFGISGNVPAAFIQIFPRKTHHLICRFLHTDIAKLKIGIEFWISDIEFCSPIILFVLQLLLVI
jgi:hypothetical protein